MITLVTADDEEIARKSLELLIITELYDAHLVASASNGAELINIVEQYKPDIAIVDINMPVISGIDAIQFLQNRGCKTKFILYTAYNEFSYVQQAIDLKVSGYLLKSDKREKSIATIRKIMEDVTLLHNEQENLKHLKNIDNQMLPIMENEILYSIYLDIPRVESFTIYKQLRKLTFSGMFMVNMIPTRATEHLYASLYKREVFSKEAISETMGNACQFLLTLSLTGGSLMIFVPEAMTDNPSTWIVSILKAFRKACIKTYCIDFIIGISQFCKDFHDSGKAYKQCIRVLQKAKQGTVLINTNESGSSQNSQEKEIANKLLHGLKRGIEYEIESVAEKYRQLDNKLSISSIFDEICKTAKNSPEISSSLCISILKERTRAKNIERIHGLVQLFLEILEQYNGNSPKDKNPYAQKAYNFIKNNAYKDISLNLVADEIGISPFYLSRLIKQEFQITFINLLMEFRMAKAIELVKNSRSQVNEIAKATGYANTAYFCKVFRRFTGKSISEYRQELLFSEIEEDNA